MRKITADWVYPIHTNPIREGVVLVDENGRIEKIDVRENYNADELEIYSGIIIPGFVNTHCHLELSHMKGKVHTGTSLIPFITSVVQQRGASEGAIQEAIAAADQYMYEQGIVAVGDISNVTDTFLQKSKSKLRYYTFTEFFDFLQEQNTEMEFAKYKAVYDALEVVEGHQKSCVPHAPYSVSPKLFEAINQVNDGLQKTVSIHNQETPPENQLFLEKKGGFIDFYGGFGIALDDFDATKKPSIYYALQHMDPSHRTLFVHNTLTTAADIQAAQAWSDQVYWATCPNANLYIENNLPNYQAFMDNNARMTIGTDSLTSNWQLSVLEEMKTIAKYQSYVPFETLLEWATLNGAKALGFEEDLGSIEVGKHCGLNLLSNLNEKGELANNTMVQRLV
ncbi:amidohydrolase family protein [Aureispira sp. CCB-E]|uniref:amidohydrolase family protein n=1 Tax=Aureispira sp. CCB-E TaxID=3051121 RepID=UPI0028688D08|nr:amidohydrolase family protein [Aureispira sp. CCB-E]WMX14792.1 amidohydrolase family protein [Aureispira sp. CCB-E]